MSGTALLERAIEIVEKRTPDLAERCMEVPLAYYRDLEQHARERALFLTKPRPIVASSEVARPDDYLVPTSMGRYLLATRHADGKAHIILN